MFPFERTRTACSASFGPIARAASRPVAPSGSSSSELSGRTTFMAEQDTSHPRDDDRNEDLDDSPAPDPEEARPQPMTTRRLTKTAARAKPARPLGSAPPSRRL